MKSEAAYAKAVADGAFAGMHKSQSAPDAPASFQVTLPWPAKALSQNARVHYMVRAKATKAARHEATWLARLVMGPAKPDWKRAGLSLTFCPPDKRRYDEPNCIGRSKALIDGIADALGIDDSKFDFSYRMGLLVVVVRSGCAPCPGQLSADSQL